MDPDKKNKLIKIISVFIVVFVVIAGVLMASVYFEREAMIQVIELEESLQNELAGFNVTGLKP